MAGTKQGAKLRWRGGVDWPKKCGVLKGLKHERLNHVEGCHPRRPKCRARKLKHEHWSVCKCGLPHYPHRIRTVDWKRGGACVHHPEHDRIMHEMLQMTDWDTGEDLESEEICSERYRE
jgi:hypothetical protein